MSNTGHCLCGAVTYSFEGDPAMVALCHCDDCQRQSGAAFSVNVGVPKAALTINGETKTYNTTGTDSGQERDRVFCPNCGSPIASMLHEMPDLAFIKAGTLDDRSNITPELEVWTEREHAWLQAGGERGRFERDLQLG